MNIGDFKKLLGKRKTVARAIKEERLKNINESGRYPNNVSRLVRRMKTEIADVIWVGA